MHASARIFDKFCLKATRDTFFVVCDQGTVGVNFLVGVISNRMRKFEFFGLKGDYPQILLLSGTSWFPHKENLEEVLDLLTMMIFKIVSESIFISINLH